METLFERLKPEIKEPLVNDIKKYPTTIGNLLKKTLKTKKAITDLTLGEISEIKAYSPTYIIDILQIYDMFEDLKVKCSILILSIH